MQGEEEGKSEESDLFSSAKSSRSIPRPVRRRSTFRPGSVHIRSTDLERMGLAEGSNEITEGERPLSFREHTPLATATSMASTTISPPSPPSSSNSSTSSLHSIAQIIRSDESEDGTDGKKEALKALGGGSHPSTNPSHSPPRTTPANLGRGIGRVIAAAVAAEDADALRRRRRQSELVSPELSPKGRESEGDRGHRHERSQSIGVALPTGPSIHVYGVDSLEEEMRRSEKEEKSEEEEVNFRPGIRRVRNKARGWKAVSAVLSGATMAALQGELDGSRAAGEAKETIGVPSPQRTEKSLRRTQTTRHPTGPETGEEGDDEGLGEDEGVGEDERKLIMARERKEKLTRELKALEDEVHAVEERMRVSSPQKEGGKKKGTEKGKDGKERGVSMAEKAMAKRSSRRRSKQQQKRQQRMLSSSKDTESVTPVPDVPDVPVGHQEIQDTSKPRIPFREKRRPPPIDTTLKPVPRRVRKAKAAAAAAEKEKEKEKEKEREKERKNRSQNKGSKQKSKETVRKGEVATKPPTNDRSVPPSVKEIKKKEPFVTSIPPSRPSNESTGSQTLQGKTSKTSGSKGRKPPPPIPASKEHGKASEGGGDVKVEQMANALSNLGFGMNLPMQVVTPSAPLRASGVVSRGPSLREQSYGKAPLFPERTPVLPYALPSAAPDTRFMAGPMDRPSMDGREDSGEGMATGRLTTDMERDTARAAADSALAVVGDGSPVFSGRLYKLGGNGRWQKREFRFDGTHLVCLRPKSIRVASHTVRMLRPSEATDPSVGFYGTQPPLPKINHPLLATPEGPVVRGKPGAVRQWVKSYQAPKWVIPITEIKEVSLLTRRGIKVRECFCIRTPEREHVMRGSGKRELASWLFLLRRMVGIVEELEAAAVAAANAQAESEDTDETSESDVERQRQRTERHLHGLVTARQSVSLEVPTIPEPIPVSDSTLVQAEKSELRPNLEAQWRKSVTELVGMDPAMGRQLTQ
ncbi:hypothetical protein BJ684DRAFT_20947 [Piptocephalis cylindrospora]|uniref:PH domain-containing protein n=1 Tax=Piptocephalis cylindrospora TaxID=1907219 RepID=A0A4P9Y1V3_9FUNG|nr:hypothetical protein BJ684DRAFT_20947 [Piptocephalis cylindrospora]|eukprot:RKP12522.1 hypothetical protein BJ684DRAFT_20947 [Piptocephalis cylindrospora]